MRYDDLIFKHWVNQMCLVNTFSCFRVTFARIQTMPFEWSDDLEETAVTISEDYQYYARFLFVYQ